MKKTAVILFSVFSLILGLSVNASAQEGSWSVGADLYNRYVWRGTEYGNSPSIQPTVEYSIGGFAIGAWGAFNTDGYQEADWYASYGFDFGLSVGVTDYYYPGSEFFDYSGDNSSHALELNLGYSIENLSLSGNYMMNESPDGAGSAGDDLYFEAGYSFDSFDVFVGAGDGWHTTDGEFDVCNVGISTSKEIKITDSFSLPVSGSAILNPETEQFYIVVGFSL